jgi:integrase
MRAFPVFLPSGARYWTVLDDNLVVVAEADSYLRHLRLGRDAAELTTRSYAGSISLFLQWCALTERHWYAGVDRLGLFITWLRYASPETSGGDSRSVDQARAVVLAGPGMEPVRGARRINAILTAVRGFVEFSVSCGDAPARLVPLIYELADDRDLPEQARGEGGGMRWRLRARHRLHEPHSDVDRASDAEIVALFSASRSARNRLIVLLMARCGLRRSEVCGLHRSDLHLLQNSAALGCSIPRAHVHVVRRDNVNGAWAKSKRSRSVPLDFLVVRAVDAYVFERLEVPRAQESDFLLVNLFREPIGAPMLPDSINELVTAAGRRAGLRRAITPHQLRHAFGSNLVDAGAQLDEVSDLLGHASMSSTQVYLHPDPGRLREAIDRVASPRAHGDIR